VQRVKIFATEDEALTDALERIVLGVEELTAEASR
jgi:hypothetical protein